MRFGDHAIAHAARGSLDERRSNVQNWRSDVVALPPELEPDGDPSMKPRAEMVRSTPYGTPAEAA